MKTMSALQLAELYNAIRQARLALILTSTPEAQAAYLRLADATEPLMVLMTYNDIPMITTTEKSA